MTSGMRVKGRGFYSGVGGRTVEEVFNVGGTLFVETDFVFDKVRVAARAFFEFEELVVDNKVRDGHFFF